MLLDSFCVLPKKHESLECRVKNLSNAVDEFHMYWGHMQNDCKHDKVGWIKNSELIYHLSDSSYSLGMFAFSYQILVADTALLLYFQSTVASQKKKKLSSHSFPLLVYVYAFGSESMLQQKTPLSHSNMMVTSSQCDTTFYKCTGGMVPS